MIVQKLDQKCSRYSWHPDMYSRNILMSGSYNGNRDPATDLTIVSATHVGSTGQDV